MSSQDKLVQAARQCLIEHGHSRCTIKRIAALAGVNHGLVHHYFGSKDELILEVIRREAEQIRRSLPEDSSRLVCEFLGPVLLQNPERRRLIFEFFYLARINPRVAEQLREVMRLRRSLIRERLGLEDETWAVLVLGAMLGMALQRNIDPGLPVEAAAQRLLALVAPGVAGAVAPHRPGAEAARRDDDNNP